jgi:hypothetical protein
VKIKRCKKCGFSLAIARLIRISDNGTIYGTYDNKYRLSIIEADFLTEIFKRIESELGFPIMHIVFEAQRYAATEVSNALMKGLRGMVRWFPLSKRLAVSLECRLAIWTGMGYAETIAYKSGKLGEAIIRNPFDRELLAACIVGAFESLEREPYGYTWRKEGDEDIISVYPEPERSEIAERMTFEKCPMKPGWRTYDRCPKCKIPLAFKYEWDENQGIVMDTDLNVRMVFIDSYTPNVVFREMAKELGEAIYPIIIDAQREFSIRHLRDQFLAGGLVGEAMEKAEFYLAVLDELALRGQGNHVEHSFREDSLRVIIENPFNSHLLAGYLCAMYELGEGRQARASWEEMDPSTLEVTLTPI